MRYACVCVWACEQHYALCVRIEFVMHAQCVAFACITHSSKQYERPPRVALSCAARSSVSSLFVRASDALGASDACVLQTCLAPSQSLCAQCFLLSVCVASVTRAKCQHTCASAGTVALATLCYSYDRAMRAYSCTWHALCLAYATHYALQLHSAA